MAASSATPVNTFTLPGGGGLNHAYESIDIVDNAIDIVDNAQFYLGRPYCFYFFVSAPALSKKSGRQGAKISTTFTRRRGPQAMSADVAAKSVSFADLE